MTEFIEKFRDKTFQCWIKASLGLCITREGLLDFVKKVVSEFHRESLRKALSAEEIEQGEVCTNCHKENILKCPTKSLCKLKAGKCFIHDKEQWQVRPCPKNICDVLRDEIIKAHSFHNPSWKNTNAEQWCTNAWEFAKCYMPPDGYLEVKSIEDTDLNGILSVMTNLKRLKRKISAAHLDEVRVIGKQVRHCPNLSLEEKAIDEYLDKMMMLFALSDGLLHESSATVEKLKRLKTNDLVISTNDVYRVLTDTLNERKTLRHKEPVTVKDQYLENIKEVFAEGIVNEGKHLSDILMAKESALKEIEDAKQALLQDISKLEMLPANSNDDFEQRKSDLKEDLLTFYQDVYSNIRVSPLVPENEAPVLEFYVQQKMENVELRSHPPSRKLLTSYNELFADNKRNIYLVAEAGVGKTTFLKRLCAIWCFSQQGPEIKPEGLQDSAVQILRKFDFLFFVILTDVQDECDVDDMIQSQIISSLSRSSQYDKQFMEKILHEKKCLVLLDGLDEWSHPKGTKCHNISSIPHRKARKNWTLLSTSRPWKIHKAQPSSLPDKYVELIELDESTVLKLAEKVIYILEASNKKGKILGDFMKETEEKGIHELIYTPMLLIQMICLWYDGRPLGKTKCQIYGNIVEFVLQCGQVKLQNYLMQQEAESHKGLQTDPPKCLQEYESFLQHYLHLIDVGAFALKTLTNKERESNLVFESRKVEESLSMDVIQFCLQTGILTKSRIRLSVSKYMSKYSFIHKTFQEYFCALFLSTLSERECAEKISSVSADVENILEYSNVIIFLSGMRPEYMGCISKELSRSISADPLTSSYRRTIGTSIEWERRFKHMKALQDMYVRCIRECESCLQETQFHVDDLFLHADNENDKVQEDVLTLMMMNKQTMKSLKVYDCHISDRMSSFLKQFDVYQLTTLQKIEIIGHIEDDRITHLLKGSAEAISCISLCKDLRRYGHPVNTKSYTSVNTINAIVNLPYLEALMLECFELPHSELKTLFDFISGKKSLTQIGLGFLLCREHGRNCSGVEINLTEHSALQMLELGDIPLSKATINTNVLEKIRLGKFQTCSKTGDNYPSDILKSLKDAANLRALMCFDFCSREDVSDILQTIPALHQLQVLVFKRVDFKDQVVNLPIGVQHIKLSDVIISTVAFRNLIEQSDNVPVKFEILECEITPENEYRNIKTDLKHSENFMVWCDVMLQGSGEQFVFNKVKKSVSGSKGNMQ